ncbi:hypothetical protein [Bradyrhizobium erythrophlei]|uniref:dTDP-4-amino-4,6-dideoxygalactose transaminase n=1 Tax=Bradyrhizobium erythrophlei TaxID=1437360 RepID=A0A1M7UHH6_9BRAD|nr:hypothetical protein [Bradyrhizobium erythrophlei]SHN82394.1 hypothetical protein SAMN05444170_5099 [Bradyrhizobium erythrophlei]
MLTMLRVATERSELGTPGAGLPLPGSGLSIARLSTGRCALNYLIQRLPRGCEWTVLMPCYVAEGVIGPFRAAGMSVRHYRLNEHLAPNEVDVANLLSECRQGVLFVLIHYFGFSSLTESLRNMIAEREAVLICDCAHAPLSSTEQGVSLSEQGDVALHSLNKFLPVTDGAIILSRVEEINLAAGKGDLLEPPHDALAHFNRHLEACRALLECHSAEAARPLLVTIDESYEAYYKIINQDLSPRHQSKNSKAIEDAFSYESCAARRRRHASYLYENLKSPSFEPVHEALPKGAVPFGVPFRIRGKRRNEVLERLFEQNVLLSTLVDKWDFVPLGRSDFFASEVSFMQDHVLVPVSEFLSEEDVADMVIKLNGV